MTIKRISSKDVARVAGVSQSAVSRAFTLGASLSEEKRKRIYDAARILDYTPNVIARSLVVKSTKIIGVVMDRFHSPFYATVLADFTRIIQESGYSVLLLNVDNEKEVSEGLSTALQYQVDGLIVTSANLNSVLVDSCLREKNTPIVFFNRYMDHEGIDAVYCDGYEGGRSVADLLIKHHKRFGCILGEETSSTSRDRFEGFVSRLRELGGEECISVSSQFNYTAGYEAGAWLFGREDRPDGVFCVSDVMALGAMDAARQLYGLSFPEDVSIVGFDDIPMASWSLYDLTTVAQPAPKMVRETVNLLLKRMSGESGAPEKKKITTRLILRSTTRD